MKDNRQCENTLSYYRDTRFDKPYMHLVITLLLKYRTMIWTLIFDKFSSFVRKNTQNLNPFANFSAEPKKYTVLQKVFFDFTFIKKLIQ